MPLRSPRPPRPATPKPRVTDTITSTWLRALPHGFHYKVPVGAWWRLSYKLVGSEALAHLRGRLLPSDLTEAALFEAVPRRPGRYFLAPVDAQGRRYVDAPLAYLDVA